MSRSLPISIIAIAFVLFANAKAALAGAETWVSPTGADTGICAITAPCRTFAYAHSQTTNNGAINVLTSGNYGPLTITKSISIVAEGVEAVINTGAGGAGIIVQTGAGAIVSLRGLTIDMRGSANIGISSVSGAALHVHDCVIRKATNGIRFVRDSGAGKFFVANTVVAESSLEGIFVAAAGAAAITAALEGLRVENGANHGPTFSAVGTIKATLRNSLVAGNAAIGVMAITDGSGGVVDLMVEHTASVNNDQGIGSFQGAVTRVGNSTLTGNRISTGSGVFSYGTNKIDGNVSNTTPPLIAMK